MWPTLLTLWRRLSGKAPRKHGRRRRPAGYRPILEVLEDRAVPASLSYSTLLDGQVFATAVDSAGDVYVTGSSSNLPTTPGAFETSGSGSFVAKLSPTGTLIYATYLGNGGGAGTGIAVDAAGDAYVIGADSGVPSTANAIASSGGADFIAELNPTGSALLYGTNLPNTENYGDQINYMSAIAVDGSGNIYVAGGAGAGFPTTAGAFQPAFAGGATGGSDAFFAKIDPALSGTASMLYSSYLGGGEGFGDAATAIALDSSGNAYLEGCAASSDFPTTSGAFQTTKGGGVFNVFVAKFDPALSGAASLVYSTYLGGTNGGSQNENNPAWGAGHVANEFGLVVPEICGGIAVDSQCNAYVTSATTSPNFPTTAGAFRTTSNIEDQSAIGLSACDVIVTKLNATGSALVYSTYLGGGTVNGNGTSSGGAGIAVDASGDAYVTGWTNSTTFPTKNAVQATNGAAGGYDIYGDGMDSFVTELNPAGSGILFSTYLGSSNNNDYDGYGISLDSAGNVYVGGGINNFSNSGFVAKINLAPSTSFVITGPTTLTAGTAATFTLTTLNPNGSADTGYSGTVQITSSDPKAVLPGNITISGGTGTFNVTLETAGTQFITATDVNNPSISGLDSGITVTVKGSPPVITKAASANQNPVTGTGTQLQVQASDPQGSNLSYAWSITSEPTGATTPTFNNASSNKTNVTFYLAGSYTSTVTVTDALGLSSTSSVTVTVNQTLTSLSVTPATVTLANRATQQFTATALDQFGNAVASQPAFTWQVGRGQGTISSSGLYTAPASGTGNFQVKVSGGGKNAQANVTVTTIPAAPSNLTAQASLQNGSAQVKLQWNNNSNNQTGTVVQRSSDGGATCTTIVVLTGNANNYTDTTAALDTSYEYRVFAYDPLGDSPFSNVVTVTTPT